MLRIRPCTQADVPAVRELLVRTWHDTYDSLYGEGKVNEITTRWHSISSLTRQLEQPLGLFLVAEHDGALVGTSKATANADGAVRLDRLYIDPGFQGVGAGKALLEAMLDAYPLAGHIDLEVEPENRRAVSFYAKHGFLPLGSTESCGGSTDIPARTMRKPLSGVIGFPSMIRAVRDADAQDLIGLITLCFAEYPGCFFDPHDDMPDIVRPPQSRLATEGQFLVVEDVRGRVGACVGVDFPERTTAELHRLYVRPDLRGRGLGKLLTSRMERFAAGRGAGVITLWSDTRFTTAHRLYEGLGYTRGRVTRSLGDISGAREYFFEKSL